MSIQAAIRALIEDRTISGAVAAAGLEEVMRGEATQAQIGAFLAGMRAWGETPEVIAACLEVTQAHAEVVPVEGVVDIVGTGGDGLDTFNVSTAAAIVVAACGVRVAKHGNRAASSKCGSADILEALGANLDLTGAQAAQVIESCGFCFLFAQRYHPGFRHAGGPRRELGTRTLFNIIGPLSNPARPRAMLAGVGTASLGPIVQEALRIRGMARAMVIHSAEGLDEISPSGPTQAWLVDGGVAGERTLQPSDFGLDTHPLSAVAGGDAVANAETMRRLLSGQRGAVRDYVLANAAAGLWVAGAIQELPEGASRAAEAIDSGRAASVLEQYIALTREAAGA